MCIFARPPDLKIKNNKIIFQCNDNQSPEDGSTVNLGTLHVSNIHSAQHNTDYLALHMLTHTLDNTDINGTTFEVSSIILPKLKTKETVPGHQII